MRLRHWSSSLPGDEKSEKEGRAAWKGTAIFLATLIAITGIIIFVGSYTIEYPNSNVKVVYLDSATLYSGTATSTNLR